MKIKNLDINWLGHSGFKLKQDNLILYIDPYQILDNEKADIILITHGHYDHCSIEDIKKIVKQGTIIVCPADVQSKLRHVSDNITVNIMSPGDGESFGDDENVVRVEAVFAYNNSKPFHEKEQEWLGYVINIGSLRIYHAGDTDFIAEMSDLKDIDIALLPIDGKFTMDVNEAIEAAMIIKSELAIPMHYGSVAGNKSDAEKFVEKCREKGLNAKLMEKS